MQPVMEKPDLAEKGAPKDGQPQRLDRRLYAQFLAMGGCPDASRLSQALAQAKVEAVVYEDLHDPRGVGLLTLHEDPDFFVAQLRPMLNAAPFDALAIKPAMTMLGRTYALGYEPDLEDALLGRPRRTALNPNWPWAVWYPLRRRGAFAQLPPDQQRPILMEHATIGRSFGEAGLAHDVRLACYGLDPNDNDFVIGLVGQELHPLSAVVQAMRKTTQTAQYIERLGPFFVGKAVWQSPCPD